MKFIQLTDTHIKKNYSEDGFESFMRNLPNPSQNVERVFSEANWKDIDFLILTGDLVHEGTKEDYSHLKNVITSCVPKDTEVLYVLGNHDRKEAFYEGFFHEQRQDSYYYEKEICGYRLIVLDSAVPGRETGTVSEEQLSWLKDILSQPSQKGSMVFLHHPVFWGNTSKMSMSLTNKEAVMEILKNSDVFAVFCGHTHTNSVQIKEGIFQCTADSTAFSMNMTKDLELQFTDKTGYVTAETMEGGLLQIHQETIGRTNAVVSVPFEAFKTMLAKLDEA